MLGLRPLAVPGPLLVRSVIAAALLCALAVGVSGYRYEPLSHEARGDALLRQRPADVGSLRRESRELTREISARMPRAAYIVVDRANNRLFLKRGHEILLDAVVSTGSGTVLQEAAGERRRWTFDTPTGSFRVLAKKVAPVWTKPDWAFLEVGQDPPDRWADRVEPGALGEYALDFGNGYMIHGTLYERLLGRSVTHGCIRVGRDDLRTLFRATSPGTPILIF